MTYELFQQGPAEYMPIILISFAITLLAYGAFPLLLAKTYNKYISKKKYRLFCYGFNFLVWIIFGVLNGGVSSGSPYVLWTWVFSIWGLKILTNKGLLEVSASAQPQDTEEDLVAVVYCRNCGKLSHITSPKSAASNQTCKNCDKPLSYKTIPHKEWNRTTKDDRERLLAQWMCEPDNAPTTDIELSSKHQLDKNITIGDASELSSVKLAEHTNNHSHVRTDSPASMPDHSIYLTLPVAANDTIRFCRICGAELPAGSRFCNKCGTEISLANETI